MIYKNFELPATLIHSVNGKKYTLNGKLLAINESAGTAVMKFGDRTNENIPLKEVYLTESSLKDLISKTGKKIKGFAQTLWTKIKGLVKTVGGLLVPTDENGNKLFQFINIPVNLPLLDLNDKIRVVPSTRILNTCKRNGATIKNNYSIDEAFEPILADERKTVETYWSRVMKEYANPENESLTLSGAIKMVNEKYYTNTKLYKALNETVVSLKSPNERFYGRFVGTDTLIGMITSSINNQLNPHAAELEGKNKDFVRPLIIWGAPGIGKTTVIKQAAKLYKKQFGKNLSMITMACGGLKYDDFELPDTVRNLEGQKMAVSIPKSWLPVIDTKGLTDEQVVKLHNYYNSGRYSIREDFLETNSKLIGKTNKKGDEIVDIQEVIKGETFDGGILFLDELSRISNLATMNVLMTLCGDRRYQSLELASQWTTICAANRMTDDQRKESDKDFRDIWDSAKIDRFTMVTYIPTKQEWLRWAREVDNVTGLQNVDELICKFIEWAPDGVWYDALDLGSEDISDSAVRQILGVDNSDDEDKHSRGRKQGNSTEVWGTDDISIDEIMAVSDYISTFTENKHNMELSHYSGRTWDQTSKTFLSEIRNYILNYIDENGKRDKSKRFNNCFSTKIRTRDIAGGHSSEQYTVKNLDLKKLKAELDKVPTAWWMEWSKSYYQIFDKTENLRKHDRLGFVLKYLGFLIETNTGVNRKPIKMWDQYQKIDSLITDADIKSIYETGEMKNINLRKDDNILLDDQGQYATIKSVEWKQQMPTVDKVISKVLSKFNENIDDIKLIKKDLERIKKYANMEVSESEYKRFVDQYTLHLTNEQGKEIKTVPTLFNDSVKIEENLKKNIIIVLKQSETARKLANLAKWVSKISIQISQYTPINALLGTEDAIGDGTISDRVSSLLDEEAIKIIKDTQQESGPGLLQNLNIISPAVVILKAMRKYDAAI